jgi:hypothetical protein
MTSPSLAERVGQKPEDRLPIINCDDLGSSHSANVAAYQSIVYGVAIIDPAPTSVVPNACPSATGTRVRLDDSMPS